MNRAGDERSSCDDPHRLGALWRHHRRWVATVLLAHGRTTRSSRRRGRVAISGIAAPR